MDYVADTSDYVTSSQEYNGLCGGYQILKNTQPLFPSVALYNIRICVLHPIRNTMDYVVDFRYYVTISK